MNFETINQDNFDEAIRRIGVALREAGTPLSFADVAERTGMPQHIVAFCLGCMHPSIQIEFGEVIRFSLLPTSKPKPKRKGR